MDPQVIATAFSLLFVMEIGDKTQLAVLSLTARTGKPMAVFIGATLSLAAITILAVTLGTVIVTLIPSEWVSRGAAIAFIVIGLFLLWSAIRGNGHEGADGEVIQTPKARSAVGVAAGTSTLLFMAELGDKSQLAVIGLTAQTGDSLSVLVGSVAALTLVTLLAALLGSAILRIFPMHWLSIGAGVMFVAIGILAITGIF